MQWRWNDPTAITFAVYLAAMLAIGWLLMRLPDAVCLSGLSEAWSLARRPLRW